MRRVNMVTAKARVKAKANPGKNRSNPDPEHACIISFCSSIPPQLYPRPCPHPHLYPHRPLHCTALHLFIYCMPAASAHSTSICRAPSLHHHSHPRVRQGNQPYGAMSPLVVDVNLTTTLTTTSVAACRISSACSAGWVACA